MIFITVGTSLSFHRLVKHIDSMAEMIDEEIIMQIGDSTYLPERCEYQRYYPCISEFIDRARLVISHGGFSCIEIIKQRKPLIIVPRQKKYHEHCNDHQVEFAQLLQLRFGVPCFADEQELKSEFVASYDHIPDMNEYNLKMFRENLRKIF